MTIVEICFWLCFSLVLYIYVGYPLCVFVLAQVLRRRVVKDTLDPLPRVTIVVAAYNEETEIEDALVNKLTQDYPEDKLDIVVVSDGSTDRTDEIVQRLAPRAGGRVRLIRQEPRQGKTRAINLALRNTGGGIVIFADANSMYAPDAVRLLVRNFADPTVGYVTGRMIYTDPSSSAIGQGCGRYISYENVLRQFETEIGSIVGVDGGIDAVRRQLYAPMQADQLPDLVLPLRVIERHMRVVYEPNAIVREPALASARAEFAMRVRVALRALWAIHDMRVLLNPLRYGLFTWQLLSHKVFRYGAFVPLLGLAFFNVLLVTTSDFYALFMLLQLTGSGLAGLGHVLRRSPHCASKLLVPYYFVVLNGACVLAWWKFLMGQKVVLWTPRRGAVATAVE